MVETSIFNCSGESVGRNESGSPDSSSEDANMERNLKLLNFSERVGCRIVQYNAQRTFEPKVWTGPIPGKDSEVFVGKIPKKCYEDELFPFFSEVGPVFRMRLMMDHAKQDGSTPNKGYGFVKYANFETAQKAVLYLDRREIRPGHKLVVMMSTNVDCLLLKNLRMPVEASEILKNQLKDRDTKGLHSVEIRPSENPNSPYNYAILEFESHRHAALAKRKFKDECQEIWGKDTYLTWLPIDTTSLPQYHKLSNNPHWHKHLSLYNKDMRRAHQNQNYINHHARSAPASPNINNREDPTNQRFELFQQELAQGNRMKNMSYKDPRALESIIMSLQNNLNFPLSLNGGGVNNHPHRPNDRDLMFAVPNPTNNNNINGVEYLNGGHRATDSGMDSTLKRSPNLNGSALTQQLNDHRMNSLQDFGAKNEFWPKKDVGLNDLTVESYQDLFQRPGGVYHNQNHDQNARLSLGSGSGTVPNFTSTPVSSPLKPSRNSSFRQQPQQLIDQVFLQGAGGFRNGSGIIDTRDLENMNMNVNMNVNNPMLSGFETNPSPWIPDVYSGSGTLKSDHDFPHSGSGNSGFSPTSLSAMRSQLLRVPLSPRDYDFQTAQNSCGTQSPISSISNDSNLNMFLGDKHTEKHFMFNVDASDFEPKTLDRKRDLNQLINSASQGVIYPAPPELQWNNFESSGPRDYLSSVEKRFESSKFDRAVASPKDNTGRGSSADFGNFACSSEFQHLAGGSLATKQFVGNGMGVGHADMNPFGRNRGYRRGSSNWTQMKSLSGSNQSLASNNSNHCKTGGRNRQKWNKCLV